MSLPALVEHPHAQYWLRAGLVRADAKVIYQQQAERENKQ